MGGGGCLNTRANNDNGGSGEHALAAPENIIDGAGENNRWNRSDVIDGEYQAGR